MKQTIRIIGGLYRGKKLHFPEIEGLRPTPDRVRETLFNWLMNHIRGARCLDAFAGSGALGIEAFSRGAATVTLVEQSPEAHAHLKKIIAGFAAPSLKLIRADARKYLQGCHEQFDIIFLDPPFAEQLIDECLNYIVKNSLIAAGGMVYLESSKSIVLNEIDWQQIKLKQAGQVFYGLFKKL
ncbi:MAG: 16S rRNA (guanine(966)-N(2))-methyltransferase RsmD [bacterium]|nr:16S rRNA (guanine(966)-N(2))-methyltransferase RsmD [bacterium]